jgi:hypothetical protein
MVRQKAEELSPSVGLEFGTSLTDAAALSLTSTTSFQILFLQIVLILPESWLPIRLLRFMKRPLPKGAGQCVS